MCKVIAVVLLLQIFFGTSSFAQEGGHEVFHAHHKLGLMIGHTQVSEGVDENGRKKWLALPSWSINYNYQFNKKWAIGLHSDIITETFKVEDHLNGENNTVIERSKPVATAIMASFKPGKHFNYLLGAGGEFASSANYFLIRVGLEYEYHLNHSWEFNACIANDLKVNAYNSFTIGMGITKVF